MPPEPTANVTFGVASERSRGGCVLWVMTPNTLRFWKPDEDALLRDMIAAGKSWTMISARLRRTIKQVRDRERLLRHRAKLEL